MNRPMDLARSPAGSETTSNSTPSHLKRLGARARAPRTLQHCAIAVCAALLLGLVLSYMSLIRSGGAGPMQTDFVAYYSGSHLVWAGHGSRIYDFHALGSFEAQLVRPLSVRNGVLPFVYPPYFALALAPLSALPYAAAYLVWFFLNCLLVALTVAVLQRYALLSGRGALLFWMAALSFLPVCVALAQGQTSILVLALLTNALVAAHRDKDVLAGGAIALALIKPPLVLPLLAVLLVCRRWRALAAFGATALALIAIPALTLGLSTTSGYVQTLIRASEWKNQFGYGPSLNHSFAGFAQLLLTAPASTAVSGILSAIALAAVAFAALRPVEVDLPLGLAVVAALLISPHILIHDLSLLLIPVAVSLRHRFAGLERRSIIRSLPALLGLGYLTIMVGLRLVASVPLQLSVLAMSALGAWLLLRITNSGESSCSQSSRTRPARMQP